jgi:hypothetical protein
LLFSTVIILYFIYYLKFKTPHFFIAPKYDSKKKNLKNPPPPYPNGWFNAMWSHELKAGEVKPVDLNGQNMVIYRGMD